MNLCGPIRVNRTGLVVIFCASLVLFIYVLNPRSGQNSSVKISLNHLLQVAIKAAENGGREVVANKDNQNVKSKGLTKEGLQDRVTMADYLSHCAIWRSLKNAYPTLKVVSEEEVQCDMKQKIDFSVSSMKLDVNEYLVNINDLTVWIDPLDATYEYSEKLYKYVTTMVCVAVKGDPIIGVIHKPFSNSSEKTFWAWVGKAKSSNLKYKQSESDNLKITVSMSHSGQIKEVLSQNLNNFDLITAAGAGFKALEVATGTVDAYLHMTEIKKWDICAGNAILNAMGGSMTTKFNDRIDYSDENRVKNDQGLIATITNHEHFIVSLSALGDILEQNYEILTNEAENWNKTRTRNMSVSGATIGIFCHYWYIFLDRRLPGYALRTVVKKIAIDQMICSPVCISSLFITTGILERKTLAELAVEARQKAWILYLAEWTVWPPAQFINFYFLPTRFRVLYDNSISLGYDIFTSYIKHKKHDDI